jgi:hypothetical protein
VSRGASQKVSEVVGARNLRMAHLVARSTCGGGWLKPGEDDLTLLTVQSLGSSLERLHGLSRKLSKGSGARSGVHWRASRGRARGGLLLLVFKRS